MRKMFVLLGPLLFEESCTCNGRRQSESGRKGKAQNVTMISEKGKLLSFVLAIRLYSLHIQVN